MIPAGLELPALLAKECQNYGSNNAILHYLPGRWAKKIV